MNIFFISISVPSQSKTLVLLKNTLISIAIQEEICSLTPHRVLLELTLISLSICEAVNSTTLLHSHLKISRIAIAKSAKLLTHSMRKAIFEGSIIPITIFKMQVDYLIFFWMLGSICLFLQFQQRVRYRLIFWEVGTRIILYEFHELRLILCLVDQYLVQFALLELDAALEE